MSSSESEFRIRIPKHVLRRIEELPLVDLRDVAEGLEEIRTGSEKGASAPDNTFSYTFEVFRPPIVLRYTVSYAVLKAQGLILINGIEPYEADEELDEGLEEW